VGPGALDGFVHHLEGDDGGRAQGDQDPEGGIVEAEKVSEVVNHRRWVEGWGSDRRRCQGVTRPFASVAQARRSGPCSSLPSLPNLPSGPERRRQAEVTEDRARLRQGSPAKTGIEAVAVPRLGKLPDLGQR
jgi:hypothetical protein